MTENGIETQEMIKVLIVSDNQIFSELLDQHLSPLEEIYIVGRVGLDETKQLPYLTRPDVILFLQKCGSLFIKKKFLDLKKSFPDSKIIFVSPRDNSKQMELDLLNMGVKGFLCAGDSLETLVRAVKSCYSGEIWASRRSTSMVIENLENKGITIGKDKVGGLTNQERRVLLLLTSGFKNAEIAEKLYISEKTVKTHINRIFKKIKVSSRLQAALWASKNLNGR